MPAPARPSFRDASEILNRVARKILNRVARLRLCLWPTSAIAASSCPTGSTSSVLAQCFAENEIDFSILGDLTDQLEKIGVAPLGHRRKLLRARRTQHQADRACDPTPSPAPSRTVATTTAAEAVGERRNVTMMFCDLVGSTGIAAKLDAEEWRDLVGAYLEAASAAVAEMGAPLPI